MRILNLTQHAATPEQVSAGVFEPENKAAIQRLLTFDTIPSTDEIKDRAYKITHLAIDENAKHAMIGGAPFLMGSLEDALLAANINPLYSFSERKVEEHYMPDGTVRKVNHFRHVGFVESV